jgi:hypothetical protein
MKAKKEKAVNKKLHDIVTVDGINKIIEKNKNIMKPIIEEIQEKSGMPINLEEKLSVVNFLPTADDLNKLKWATEIEAICNEQGILPEDMVKEWKEMKTIPVKELRKYAKNGKELFNEKEIKAIIDEKVTINDDDLKKQLEKTRQEQLEQELIYVNKEIEKRNGAGLSKWQLELRKKKLGI